MPNEEEKHFQCDHDFTTRKSQVEIKRVEEISTCYKCGSGAYVKDDVMQALEKITEFFEKGEFWHITEAAMHLNVALQKTEQYGGHTVGSPSV